MVLTEGPPRDDADAEGNIILGTIWEPSVFFWEGCGFGPDFASESVKLVELSDINFLIPPTCHPNLRSLLEDLVSGLFFSMVT